MFNLEKYNEKCESYVGCYTWWSFETQRRNTEAIKEAMIEVGLSEDYLPKTRKKRVFTDACNYVRKTDGYDLVGIKDTKDELVLKFVSKKVDANSTNIEFDQHTLMTFNKIAGTIIGFGREDVVKRVADTFEAFLSSENDSNFRIMIKNVLDSEGAAAMRPTGGIYFMPKKGVSKLEKLAKVVAKVTGGKLKVSRVPDLDEEKENVADSVKSDLAEKYESLLEKVQKAVRLGAVEGYKEDATKLNALTDYYVELLNAEQELDSFKASYANLEKEIETKMKEIEDKKAK